MEQRLTPSHITSPEAAHTADPLRDLVLRTSYNRSQNLDVPVFGPPALKPRIVWHERVLQGMYLGGGGAAVRSLALPARALALAMATDVRYEPTNDTPVHRSYPSPRGLFAGVVEFVFCRQGQEVSFAYDETHDALLPAALEPENSVPVEGWELRVRLLGSLEKIAPLYGGLTVTLVALELGHLLHQICAALHLLDVAFDCRVLAAPDHAQDGEAPGYRAPLVDIILAEHTYCLPRSEDFTALVRVATPTVDRVSRNRIARERTRMASPWSAERDVPCARRCRKLAVAHARGGCLRSSGNFTGGIHGKTAPPLEVDALLEAICHEHRRLTNSQLPRPSLTILRPGADFTVRVIPVDPDAPEEVVANGCVPLSEAYGTFYNIDIQTIPLVVVFSADFGLLMQQSSSWSYMEALIVAGVCAQAICNEAATRGFVARPFRGMKEDILETAFNLGGQVFYTVLLGKSTERNPALSLPAMFSGA